MPDYLNIFQSSPLTQAANHLIGTDVADGKVCEVILLSPLLINGKVKE